MLPKAFGLTLALMAAEPALAQQTTEPAPEPIDYSQQWLLSIGLERVSINSEAAKREYINEDAFALVMDGEYFINRNFSATFGFAFMGYDDNASFSQEAENQWTGDRETLDSSASGVPIYSELGYKHFSGGDNAVYFTARAGVAFIALSERSIENCDDCYSEDIDISGGLYGALGAGFAINQQWSLGVKYKNYFSGDLNSGFALNVSVKI